MRNHNLRMYKNCLKNDCCKRTLHLIVNCILQEIRCKNNGSCLYEGQMYENWSELPSNVTGCEKRCYCDMGNVSCQAACPPVPAEPPSSLHCPPRQAKLAKLPNDDCCQKWVCDLTSTPGIRSLILCHTFCKISQTYLIIVKENQYHKYFVNSIQISK